MIDALQAYPEYKESGIAWLGKIPAHWEVRPLRTILKQRNEKNNPIKTKQILSLSIAHGVTLYSHEGRGGNKSKSDLTAYKIARKGDIVLNSMNVVVGAVGLSKYTGAISPVYYALYPITDNININYFDKVFSNYTFQRYLLIYGKGILIKKGDSDKLNTIRMKISAYDLKKTLLPLPKPEEQKQIARFINWKTDQINKFISNRRQLIEVLNEQKHAIINRAVTRGLDPNVKLKPSGIDWLGGIPEHWEVRKLGNLGSFSKGRGISRADITDAGVPAITYGDIYTTYGVEAKQLEKYTSALVATNAQEILKGDLLFTASGETIEDIGKTTLYSGDVPGYAGGDIIILRPTEGDGLYLSYVLNSSLGVQQKSLFGRGDIIVHIAASKLKQIIVPFPSKEEQTSIARFLNNALKCLHAAISRAQDEIDLIREYRTRLIADVVTGKVDVRGIAVERKKSAATVIQFPKEKKSGGPKANVHFRRSVFAAEIVHRLHAEPTFGHVKFEKLIFLCEKRCGVDTGSTYYRQAAGPYDNRALRSIDGQMKKQKWYAARKVQGRYQYVPLAKAGGHKTYFSRYFADIEEEFSNIIEMFRKLDTERCEIVVTLYSAWEDLLANDEEASEDSIVEQVLHHWHPSKQRIGKDRWYSAIGWMKEKGFVPKVTGVSHGSN